MLKFGWDEANSRWEIDYVKLFFNNKEADSAERAKILHSLLCLQVKAKFYSESCELWSTENGFELRQYDEKEFYHDGSVQSRQFFSIKKISAEEYEGAKEKAVTENPYLYGYAPEWFDYLSDCFFVKRSGDSNCDIYARDFLSEGYVRLWIENYY